MYCSYILKSQKDGKYYYGSSSDFQSRLKAHNAGKVHSTRSRRPLVLHYQEFFETKTEALKRENFYKSIDGYNWLKNQGII